MFGLFLLFAFLAGLAILCMAIAVIAFLIELLRATSRVIGRAAQPSSPSFTWVLDEAEATPAELKRVAAVHGGRMRIVYFDRVTGEWSEAIITSDMPEAEIVINGH
jgi:hypothetical protein